MKSFSEFILEERKKCKDGYEYDKDKKRCVRKRPYHTGGYLWHSHDHDHDGEESSGEGSGGGDGGGGGGE